MTAIDAHDPPATNLDHALTYARRGWRVVPVPTGRKVPTITAWQKEGTTDEARIRHWWGNAPDHGIGIVTGPESGLWVLDVDVADGKRGDETLAEHVAVYGPLPDTHEVITGSDGRHIYFPWPTDGTIIRNSASGTLGPGLDVRGLGGFVVAPPSIHANGNAYQLDAGCPEGQLAPAPGWLIAMLTRNDEPRTPRPLTPASGDRPGDMWAASVTWADLLVPDGWTALRPGPDGEDRWTRPGKEAREGPSATTGHKGSDVLKVFTSSVPALRADETYTKLGYIAATRHGGDHSAAAAWCREQGYGAPRIDLDAAAADLTKMAEPEPWGDPTPWPEPARLPDFPLHTLPDWVEPHAIAAAEARQVPVDLCAMLAIGALSAACTGRALVVVTDGWHEPVNLYLTVAMRSGAGKSPAEKAMVSWLRKWERDLIAAQTPAHDEASILAKMADKKYRKLTEGALAEASDVLNAARDAQTAKDAVPALPRLIIDDTTPEAVATLLAAHGERLAILSTEADLFDGLLRGNPAQRPNMNVYLKAWSGDEMRRDRKGGSEKGPESTILERPLLTVSATVQPSVLARVLTDGEMVSRGFAARFMFAAPDDIMGQRDQRLRFRSGDLATAANYETVATDLASRWNRWANPAHLRLGPDAAAMYEDFLVELEPSLAIGGDLEQLAEWVAKMVASVARYAGLLHLSEMGDAGELVAGETMARAIDLGRYWLAHAAGIAATEADATVAQARAILDWIAASGAESVTLNEVHRGVRRPGIGLSKAVDYVPPVDLLIEYGWLRADDGDRWSLDVGTKGGRSPVLRILPSVVGSSPDAVVARGARGACMGERESLSPSLPPHTPIGARATRSTRYNSEPPASPPVDNPGGEPPDVSPDDPADPTDWMTL